MCRSRSSPVWESNLCQEGERFALVSGSQYGVAAARTSDRCEERDCRLTKEETGDESSEAGFWRAVLEALESNSKAARLVVILLAVAAVAAELR